jgi:hypothetical protein
VSFLIDTNIISEVRKGDRCYGGRWITPPELRADMADPARRHQVDPARYYFRTNPLFETGAQAYAWLNDIVCVGAGYLVEGSIAYKVSQVV